MTDETRNPEDVAPDAEKPAAEAAPQADAPAEDPIAALEAENAKMKDQLLRTLAEMENLRRRTEKEVREAGQYSISGFARDMLNVGDNLRRALETVTEEARAGADATLTGLLEGVEMTERDMLKLLEKNGIARIDPAGERFDPNLHQAMFEVPDPTVTAGTVVQVMQAGYKIGDRVLRPALVGVAKGGPKPAKPEAASEADAEAPAPGEGIDKTV
ncbi:MAG: nucleotide exchange factor GrpE [Hyphomicrobiales bacterium]|nr:MAG: nucleotide exchange factor GrpE [Hyphomicrobiales bacterium]